MRYVLLCSVEAHNSKIQYAIGGSLGRFMKLKAGVDCRGWVKILTHSMAQVRDDLSAADCGV